MKLITMLRKKWIASLIPCQMIPKETPSNGTAPLGSGWRYRAVCNRAQLHRNACSMRQVCEMAQIYTANHLVTEVLATLLVATEIRTVWAVTEELTSLPPISTTGAMWSSKRTIQIIDSSHGAQLRLRLAMRLKVTSDVFMVTNDNMMLAFHNILLAERDK